MSKIKTYHSWDQIIESKLLSPERVAELENLVKSRFEDVYNQEGKKLNGIKSYYLIEKGEKASYIYNTKYETFNGYYFREVLTDFLTDEEVNLINKHCFAAARKIQEDKRFDLAKKVNLKDYTGDGFYWGDTFCQDEEYLEFEFEDLEPEDRPKYVWGAEKQVVVPSIDVSDVLERFIETNGYEDMEIDDFKGVKELKEALDKFVEINNTICSYEPDYRIAVLI